MLAPGAYDALSARLVEQAGFDVVYMTGSGMANSFLGQPDLGLTTMTEMVSQATRVCDSVSLPLIADADTGYGGPLNVRRTVREYERAGVAALHIEDQSFPKRCGHFQGKQLIPVDEMVQKLAAARAARQDPALVIIARTDAIAVEGFNAALDRARAYQAAGADALFIEGPRSLDELEEIGRTFSLPLVANMVEGGSTPLLPAGELGALGFKIVLYASAPLRTAVRAVQGLLSHLRERGSTVDVVDRMISFDERNRVTDLEEALGWADQFSKGRVEMGARGAGA
jgi:2-methylisocitrate lyase-like PEP mutase family enzyme